jgi:4-amino-4-deoxy-L-arabinose transferase-like glycosyltransferase
MSHRARQIVTVLLALFGVEIWLNVFHGMWGQNQQFYLLVAAILLPLIPGVAPAAWIVLKRLHHPTPLARRITMLFVMLAAATLLAAEAITSHRDLYPVLHDENQFLLQTRMLSVGRLWMPGLPPSLYDFFDTFYVLIDPKYAAQSFPGTAFLFVASIWLGIVQWKWAIALSAITIGLFYRVVTEFIGGLPGLMAAMLLSKLAIFEYVSTMILAQVPAMLLGLALIWAYLTWRRTHTRFTAALIGFFAGWAFITRPADGLIFILPVAAGVLFDLSQISDLKSQILAATLAAMPWIAIMLAFDRGVTGHWLTTPFDFYNQRDQPGLKYTLTAQSPGDPLTKLPSKRGYYLGGVVYRIKEHRPELLWNSFVTERFPQTVPFCLPQPMLGALLPIGFMLWSRRRAWVLACGIPMFFLLYLPYPIFIQHYVVVAAPAEIFAAVLGIAAMASAWPRARKRIWIAAMIFVVGFMFTRSTEIAPMMGALRYHTTVLKVANETTAALAAKGQPAVVLFKHYETELPDWETVYNTTTAWPDDAMVIRAHDRDDDWKIFQYYATHGPDRAFYQFDELKLDNPLTYLGLASELAKSNPGH